MEVIVGSLGALFVVLTGLWVVFRAEKVSSPVRLPAGFPDSGFPHSSFEELLRQFVDAEGNVDYSGWSQDDSSRRLLKEYLAAVAQFSPDNVPERFPSAAEAKAYWLYAYNALVIDAILERWPLASVTDVKGPLEVTKGFGFFYRLRFVVGGEWLSLYSLEHKKVIARAEDPRMHFVLNCASRGCPRLRPHLPTGDELEAFLASSAAEFVAQQENVAIDHENQTITLSKIFDWYREDFVNELRRRNLTTDDGVLGYLPLIAGDELCAELERSRAYRVVIRSYDWSLNSSKRTDHEKS